MREIKFRALYDHMGGGWKYGMLIYEGDVPRIQVDGTMTFATCLKGTECQFTGLHDKNNNHIYEGDIIECGYGTGEVVFMLGSFLVRWIDDKEATMEFVGFNNKCRRQREDDEKFEIIGNIYEGYQCPQCNGTGSYEGKTGGSEGIPEADVEFVCGECVGTGKIKKQ